MSAYNRAFAGLVDGGLTPDAAALVLAELRHETCTELAAGLNGLAHQEYQAQPGDSLSTQRKRKARAGAVRRAADWVLAAAAKDTPTNPTEPAHTGQRTNGSTT